jgi:hypothetical protein
LIALALLLLTPQDGLMPGILRCGIAPVQVSVRYDTMLQADIVSLTTPSPAIDDKGIECLITAMRGVFLEAADPTLQTRYDRRLNERARAQMLPHYRQWLSERGLLNNLPRLPRGGDVLRFARALETHCGIEAGTKLTPLRGAFFTVKLNVPIGKADPAFDCLIAATFVSNPDPADFQLGFVGNEQFAEPATGTPHRSP